MPQTIEPVSEADEKNTWLVCSQQLYDGHIID
jgi:hypothetical protein